MDFYSVISSYSVNSDCCIATCNRSSMCFLFMFFPSALLCMVVYVRMLLVSVMLSALHEASLCLLREGWAPAGSCYVFACRSQWFPQYPEQEASCLIDWDAHHQRPLLLLTSSSWLHLLWVHMCLSSSPFFLYTDQLYHTRAFIQ